LKEYTTHNDALRQEVEVMRNEKSQLAERLVTYDERAEEQFYDKLSEEKEKSRMYQAQVPIILYYKLQTIDLILYFSWRNV
jgi:uncharacterized protein YecE (DUF72 family)